MFEVRSVSPLDDDWQSRDSALKEAAGRRSDFSGAGFGKRDHGWDVATFEEAQSLKVKLSQIENVTVSVREKSSH